MNKPKVRAALSDSVGTCELCKQAIVSDNHRSGYTEYVEFNNKKYHRECIGLIVDGESRAS